MEGAEPKPEEQKPEEGMEPKPEEGMEPKFDDAKAQKISQMVDLIFTKFDADNSGGIDLEEARPIFIEELKKTGATKI